MIKTLFNLTSNAFSGITSKVLITICAILAGLAISAFIGLKHYEKSYKENLAQQAEPAQKQIHKEQRGIYNVTYNGKNATYINLADDEAHFLRLSKGNKNKGGTHIRLEHSTDSKQQGYVTPDEVANLGQNLRSYLQIYKEPFIDKNGAKIYEWQKENVRFRAVINKPKESKGEGNSNLPQLSKPLSDEIITFYSDRNLKNAMDFKNPILNTNKCTLQNTLDSTPKTTFTRE